MPYNGSGVFTPVYIWVNDANQGINIRADRMDGQDGDIATALSNCVTCDGQSTVLANINLGGFKFLNGGTATLPTDYVTLQQLQDTAIRWLGVAGGTANAITLNANPPLTSYVTGVYYSFLALATNTGPTTVNINGLGPISIVKDVSANLAAGDIQAGQYISIGFDGTNFQTIAASAGGGPGPSPTQGLYVVVGASGKISSSTDGVNFTAQTVQLSGNNLSAVAYDGTAFLYCSSVNANICTGYTINGTTFINGPNFASAYALTGIAATSTVAMFAGTVATAGANVSLPGDNATTMAAVLIGSSTQWGTNQALIATDGTNFLAINNGTSGYPSNYDYALAGTVFTKSYMTHSGGGSGTYTFLGYVGGYWMVGYSSGDISYKGTLTGTALTNTPSVVGSNAVNKIVFTGTKYVVGCSGGKVANATTIGTWTVRTTGLSGNITGMAYFGGSLVIGTDQGEVALSTNNGDSWTILNSAANPFGGSAISFVKYRLTKFWIGSAGGKLGQSSDGTAFSLVPSNFGTATINDMEAI